MSYENDFDMFYRQGFRHDPDSNPDDLLLDHYPFSVSIDVPDGGRWLELGVGTGRVVAFHCSRMENVEIYGLDYSARAIETARTLLPEGIRLLQGDMRALPFEYEYFDLITMFGTIQALPKAKWFEYLKGLLRYLKPGGKLGFSVHPCSGIELLRCIQSPRSLRNITSKNFLVSQARSRGMGEAIQIEKHHVYILPKLLARLRGRTLPHYYGFSEFPKTRRLARICHLLRRLLPTLTFGHYWIWIDRDRTRGI